MVTFFNDRVTIAHINVYSIYACPRARVELLASTLLSNLCNK